MWVARSLLGESRSLLGEQLEKVRSDPIDPRLVVKLRIDEVPFLLPDEQRADRLAISLGKTYGCYRAVESIWI